MVHIPDDPKYIAAFKGALYALAKPYAWGDDDAHTALDVGNRMSDAFASIQEIDCENTMLLRACTLDCGIEYSTDGGDTWTCISLANCITDLVDSGISQAIEDGLLQKQGGQPGPATAPAPGECKTYHVKLRANERWKIPSPMNAGDTLAITNISGGWTDGAFQWYCYDGTAYVLGACTGNVPYLSADPLHSGNHMMLIGGYNTTTPVYFAVLGGYAIPAGVVNQEAWLQANDSPLSDNSGEIEFDVTVCTSVVWCYTMDFAAANGGFQVVAGEAGVWNAGSGWAGAYQSANSNPECAIYRTVNPCIINRIVMEYDMSNTGGNASILANTKRSGTQTYYYLKSTPSSGTHQTFTFNAGNAATDWIRLVVNNGNYGGTNLIRRVTFYGVGANPFGADNCTP